MIKVDKSHIMTEGSFRDLTKETLAVLLELDGRFARIPSLQMAFRRMIRLWAEDPDRVREEALGNG